MIAFRPTLTLGIHPTTRGFSWIAFENPLSPFDWGNAQARRGDKNALCLSHFERLIDRLEPDTIVIEAFERSASARGDRTRRLCRSLVALARARGIEVAIFNREDVKRCFAEMGAVTRQEVATAIARHLPALAARLPKPRKIWMSEHPRMALFSAAALVLTHYRFLSAQVLDELKKGRDADEE